VDEEVRRQLTRRQYGVIGDDDVVLAVVENADDTAILHRPACEVTHTLAGAFAEEVSSFEVGQFLPYCDRLTDSWHVADLVVDEVSDVHRDVTAVALSPSVLPQIAGDFRDLVDLFLSMRGGWIKYLSYYANDIINYHLCSLGYSDLKDGYASGYAVRCSVCAVGPCNPG
jgi:hypothetical protein